MYKSKRLCAWTAFLIMLSIFVPSVSSAPKKGSEVIVRRVDSNGLVRLRVFLDGKSMGTLQVGQTAVYKVKDGYHTLRVGFQDFQQRSTEVAQFRSLNSTHVFSVTDNSVVLVSEETTTSESVAPTPIIPVGPVPAPVIAAGPGMGGAVSGSESSLGLDNAIRSAFDKTTKKIASKKKVAVINVEGDNKEEAAFVLEELTLLSVNSPKELVVIDRRRIDAYRSANSLGVPSYENDHVLQYIGQLMDADYVVSGTIDGAGDLRRLRVKAMDVKTGNLVGDSSERL